MKASGSGRMPGNFWIAASTSSVDGVAVRVFAGSERLRLLPPLAAGDVGEQLKQHVGRGPERDAVDQHVAQCAPADRESPAARSSAAITASASAGSLVGKQPEGVADRIVEPPLSARSNSMCQVSFSEPGLLRRLRDEKDRVGRIIARAATDRGAGAAGAAETSAAGVVGGSAVAANCELLVERLEHAGGFLAAGHAEIQPLFLLARTARRNSPDNCIRIVRSPAAPSPPSCGGAGGGLPPASCAPRAAASGRAMELHRRRRRRAGLRGRCRRHQRRSLRRRQLLDADAFDRYEAGEEPIEPGALLGGERCLLGDELRGSADAVPCSCDGRASSPSAPRSHGGA